MYVKLICSKKKEREGHQGANTAVRNCMGGCRLADGTGVQDSISRCRSRVCAVERQKILKAERTGKTLAWDMKR